MSKYATIVADPPWAQKGGPLRSGVGEGFIFDGAQTSQDLPYATLSAGQIAGLQVRELAADDAHLYLWATNKYLRSAFDVVEAWGFAYSTTLVWTKKIMGGGLGGAYGISTEFCLFARRGSLPAKERVRGTWFPWKRPYNERGKPKSSAKPPEFMEQVERVSPGPYVELFAREARPGWDRWGNELDNTVELVA